MPRVVLLLILVFSFAGAASSQGVFRLYILKKFAEPLYRKPTKNELLRIAPANDLKTKYADFLGNPKTGLTRLVLEIGCSDSAKVISAKKECLKYSMPGGGSSFSFRTRNYRLARLADITYTDNSFQATGQFLNGVFVNLGDVPLESIGLHDPSMEFLTKYTPSVNYRSALYADKVLSIGFIYKGLVHRRALYIKENTTFALRSIAYRGKLYRAVAGVTYNELDFDKRRDTIVVFRIVRTDDDASVTILWKILSEKEAPKLKREKR